MLSSLEIVKGAVSRKDLSPVLRHLLIRHGWVMATNGRMTIYTPIEGLDEFDMIVPADKFITAVKACKNPKFKITDTGRLSITGGGFRALLPLMNGVEFPTPKQTGTMISDDSFIHGLTLAHEFMGDDASRPWSNGVLFHKGYVYATNNVIMVRADIGWTGPTVNVPSFLVEELLRIKKKPTGIRVDEHTITLQLEDNVWINSVLLPSGWPNAKALFDRTPFDGVKPIPDGLGETIKNLVPFCPNPKMPVIVFSEEGVSTESGDQEAAVQVEGLSKSRWRAEPLIRLLSGASGSSISIDFSLYPAACPWIRENGSEGLIIGLRE